MTIDVGHGTEDVEGTLKRWVAAGVIAEPWVEFFLRARRLPDDEEFDPDARVGAWLGAGHGDPLWGHPDLRSYAESLEAALGWFLATSPSEDGLAEATAVWIDENWRAHLVARGRTHPDD